MYYPTLRGGTGRAHHIGPLFFPQALRRIDVQSRSSRRPGLPLDPYVILSEIWIRPPVRFRLVVTARFWRHIDSRPHSLCIGARGREPLRVGGGQPLRGASGLCSRGAPPGSRQGGTRTGHGGTPEHRTLPASPSHHRELGAGRCSEGGECLRPTHRSRASHWHGRRPTGSCGGPLLRRRARTGWAPETGPRRPSHRRGLQGAGCEGIGASAGERAGGGGSGRHPGLRRR